MPGIPGLAGNPVLQSEDPTSLIHIMLMGGTLPATHTAPSTFTMPGFAWRLFGSGSGGRGELYTCSWGSKVRQ